MLAIYISAQPEEMKPFLVHEAIVRGKVEGAFISIVQRRGEMTDVATRPFRLASPATATARGALVLALVGVTVALAALIHQLRILYSGSCSCLAGSRAMLPYADRVTCWITGHRYPQVPFRVRRLGHRAPGSGDLGNGVVNVLYVDVGHHASLTSDRQVGHEVADDVATGILEAVGSVLGLPAEHGSVKGC